MDDLKAGALRAMQRIRIAADCEQCGKALFQFFAKHHWDKTIKCMHCGAVHAPVSEAAKLWNERARDRISEISARPPNEMEPKAKCAKCGLSIPKDHARVVDPAAGTQQHFTCPNPGRS